MSEDVQLNISDIEKNFPFFLVFDNTLNITHIGENLQKNLPNPCIGTPIQSYFKIVQPEGVESLHDLSKHRSPSFVITSSNQQITLRGQVLVSSDNNIGIYLASPLHGAGKSEQELSQEAYTPFSHSHEEHVKNLQLKLRGKEVKSDLMYQAAALATKNISSDEMYKEILTTICEKIGWPIGHLYEISKEIPNLLNPTSIWYSRDPESFKEFHEVTEKTTFEIGIGLPGRILKSKQPEWIKNIQEDSNFPRANLCKNINLKGAFGFPVLLKGEVIAVLEFFSESELEQDSDLLELAQSISWQLSQVVEKQNALDALVNANELKSEFVAMVSHEIRTPLSSLSESIEILNTSELNDDQKAMIDIAINGTQRLRALINDILDISKIDAGSFVLKKSDFNINELITQTLKMLSPLFTQKSIFPMTNFLEENLQVHADKERIAQILTNLMGNALKFSTDGASVEINTKKETDHILVSVKDTGEGIPEDQLDSIFERYVTLSDKNVTSFQGTGFGLYLCKSLIDLHGGKIWVESNKDYGTTFFFTLPLEETIVD